MTSLRKRFWDYDHSRREVEPASLRLYYGDGRVEGNESVSVLLYVLQVGPNGQSNVTGSEPVVQ
jgi:hypothetical protein